MGSWKAPLSEVAGGVGLPPGRGSSLALGLCCLGPPGGTRPQCWAAPPAADAGQAAFLWPGREKEPLVCAARERGGRSDTARSPRGRCGKGGRGCTGDASVSAGLRVSAAGCAGGNRVSAAGRAGERRVQECSERSACGPRVQACGRLPHVRRLPRLGLHRAGRARG